MNSVPGVTGEDSDMLTRADGVALGSVLTTNSFVAEVSSLLEESLSSTVSLYRPVGQVAGI